MKNAGFYFTVYRLSLCAALVFIAIPSLFAELPSYKEIQEEIKVIRENKQQLQDNYNWTAGYLMDRVDEAVILDQTTDNWDYYTKNATFWFPVTMLRLTGVSMVLLTKDNAPKTYAFIEEVAHKVGLTSIPLIYLVADEGFFNAFAAGLLHSMSIVGLGEKMLKNIPTTEALEFLVAHELVHVKNRHAIKKIAVWVATVITMKYLADLVVSRTCTHQYILPTNQPGHGIMVTRQVTNPTHALIRMIGSFLIQSYYSRICERDADKVAADSVGTPGGIDLLTMIRNKTESHVYQDYEQLREQIKKTSLKDSSLFHGRVAVAQAFSTILDKMATVLKVITYPFESHPTLTSRIHELQER